MIALVDYGVGNLFSLCSSLMAIGAEVCVTGDPKKIRAADKVVLPGVGAFGDAAFLLHNNGLDVEVQRAAQAGNPLLGICLGMQLLLDQSLEYGVHTGLGLIPGTVRPIRPLIPAGYKVPHIGWNTLQFADGGPVHPLFSHIHAGDCVYFVHSYYAESPDEVVIARTEYGSLLTAAVAQDNVMGVQFHPEKSGDVGLNILRAFCEME